MNVKTDKKLIQKAIANGCKTAAQLAHFLKVQTLVAQTYKSI
jgi:bacterioferritin-associated ferredoxin